MSDEALRQLEAQALQGDRRALMQLKAAWARLRTDGEGLLYATTDGEVNAAVKSGRHVTTRLVVGDLAAVAPNDPEEEWGPKGPWIACVSSTQPRDHHHAAVGLAVDTLGSEMPSWSGVHDSSVEYYLGTSHAVITVLRRFGVEAVP